ncbi:uncharacterized protein BJX67DRAFT_54286 [Aspergillus lucknowensis]|uniref:Uncharacterized protein n=1 Tax=Aspergillus lucknowensis TaxID=176173 RepID=A0ABR4LVW7_9EURO
MNWTGQAIFSPAPSPPSPFCLKFPRSAGRGEEILVFPSQLRAHTENGDRTVGVGVWGRGWEKRHFFQSKQVMGGTVVTGGLNKFPASLFKFSSAVTSWREAPGGWSASESLRLLHLARCIGQQGVTSGLSPPCPSSSQLSLSLSHHQDL